MFRRQKVGPSSSEITDESLFRRRRTLLCSVAAGLVAGVSGRSAFASENCKLDLARSADKLTKLSSITSYNNYYEFSTNKEAVRILARELTLRPWTLQIDGEVEKPLTLDIDQIITRFDQQERIYRLRCVEGWSMVIPWTGFSLCNLLKLAAPTSAAKYVEFVSLQRPSEMIGQRRDSLSWPYTEGLRIDEAMHPLTMVATGLYGKDLPPQNGAPLRIIVPWKYGFKSPKAITHIRLRSDQPKTSWMQSSPSEYGFYANVNPNVSHPRWTQTRENRIGELRKHKTLLFNGYADQVASLYQGMDLQKYY